MSEKTGTRGSVDIPHYLRMRRYVYSQENFDQYLSYIIEKGKCPKTWTEIVDLGLAKTEVSARSLDVIARAFELIDSDHQLTPLAVEMRTVSGRAQVFRQILQKYYPDFLKIVQETPEESRDIAFEDYLKRIGVLSIDPRVRIIRMFKYLCQRSEGDLPRKKDVKTARVSLPQENPEPLHDIIQAKKLIPEKDLSGDNLPKPKITSSPPEPARQENPVGKNSDDTPILRGNPSDENIFQILTSIGKPIIIHVPAGVTTDDIKFAIKLLEAAYIS